MAAGYERLQASDPLAEVGTDLFFDGLVRGYVAGNARLVRRSWLAKMLDEQLAKSGPCFILLTAEPGVGKSVFMAELAHDHPEWLRYFIRRDQREVLSDVSATSFLLRIGYELAAIHPALFRQDNLHVSVAQRFEELGKGAEAVGAEIRRLLVSPFYQKVIEIEQHVQANEGKVVGLRVEELITDTRQLQAQDLLQMALIDPARALQRTDPRKQIVILVDALDEIRYHQDTENILAWLTNCPELPENIRFVLTSRPPGEALKLFCDKQATRLAKLEIGSDNKNVKQDVQTFVTELTGEPAIARALQEAEDGAQAFAKRAADKAHGNLGYLDALARGMDQAIGRNDATLLRELFALKELPGDLEGLYAFFLHQIKTSVARERIELKDHETGEGYDKPVWPAVYDRILGVLAVAMEPVDLEVIERLGEIRAERAWVLQALEHLLQLLEVNNSRYRLYHATVAEFLTSEKTRDSSASADLYQDAKKRQRQITDKYWHYQGNWTRCDDYGLRNLAAHLYQSEQFARLDELIGQPWMKARVAHDDGRYNGFVADVMLACQRAHDEALRQIEADQDEWEGFTSCFRYTLIRASINSLSTSYSPELIQRALQTGAWNTARALDVAAHLPDPGARTAMYRVLLDVGETTLTDVQRHAAIRDGLAAARTIENAWRRAIALMKLAPALNKDARTEVLAEALAAARTIEDSSERAEVLRELAPALNEDARTEVLAEALAAARTIAHADARAEELAALAPHVNGTTKTKVLAEALAAVRAIEWEERRARVLRALAPQLTGDALGEAMAVALTFANESYRGTTLEGLAPQMSGEDLGEALAAVQAIRSEAARAEALTALAPHLNREQFEDALTAARAIGYEGKRATVLLALAAHHGGEQLGALLTAARDIDDENRRCFTLLNLAHYLSGEQVGDALAAALTFADEWYRGQVLAALAPQMSGEQLGKALAAARAIRSGAARAEALRELALALNKDARTEVLAEALAAARTIEDSSERAEVLRELAPALNEDARTEVLAEALAAARTIEDSWTRAIELMELAPALNEDARTEVLAEALAAARTIEDAHRRWFLIGKLAPQLRGELVGEALAATASAWNRDELLAALAPYLSCEQLREVLTREQAIGTTWSRERVLKALVPHLSGEQMSAVLAAARAIDDEETRANAIVVLAPQLRRDQLSDVLAVTRAIASEKTRARALTALAPRFDSETKTNVLGEALTAARAIRPEEDSAEALAALAPQLGGELLGEALVAARAIAGEGSRAWVLAALAPQFNGDAKTVVLREALATAKKIPLFDSDLGRRSQVQKARARAMIALASQFRGSEKTKVLGEALEAVRRMASDWPVQGSVGEPLAALAPQLTNELISEALIIARSIKHEGSRVKALTTVAHQVSAGRKAKILREALATARTIEYAWGRADALTALAPQVSGRTKTGVLDEALTAARAIEAKRGERAKALTALLLQVSGRAKASVFEEALTAARMIENSGTRALALAVLPLAADDKVRVREIRYCLIDYLWKQLSAGRREDVLETIIRTDVVRPPILSNQTVTGLAQHMIEIAHRWEWL